MGENKKKNKLLAWVLLFLNILLFVYFLFTFYNEYSNLNHSYQKINLEEKRKKILENREKILLGFNNPTNIGTPFLTIFEDNKDLLLNLKKEYSSYKDKIKENIEKSKSFFQKEIMIEIPSLNLDVKLHKLDKGTLVEIEEKLKKGVIKYSSTSFQDNGVVSIFGHSSQPIGTRTFYSYFRKIPNMMLGDNLILKRDGEEILKYKTIDSKEVTTDDLKSIFDKYEEKGISEKNKYLILITCYPINTTKKRWIVILKEEDKNINGEEEINSQLGMSLSGTVLNESLSGTLLN